MKKLIFTLMAAALVCSCSKENLNEKMEEMQESVLYVNLKCDGQTKATGDGHGIQADDSYIQTLEVFVFRINEGYPDDGVLDGYRKFTAAELGSLSNLEIETTTGKKMIYAVANAHRANWKGINTRALFEQQTAMLGEENLKNFIMTGGTEAQLQIASTVSFPIKRMVSRVSVNSVKTLFAGGPYEGMKLTDVNAYLIHAQGMKYIYNGSGDNLKIYNKGEYKKDDAEACAMPGMIYDVLDQSITDAGYNVPHYFYCYENAFTQESEGKKFTRVVIEGKLNGVTYYYPIVIRDLKRNCCYSVDVTIKRPGSQNPDSDVEKGTLLATVSVQDWNVLPGTSVEF